jgi:hypothetical protein
MGHPRRAKGDGTRDYPPEAPGDRGALADVEGREGNPGSVRIIVEDEEGVKIVERPYRPRNIRMEPDGDRVDFKRHMIRRVG